MKRYKFKKIYCEITNICNLNCDFCPSSQDSDIDKKFMSKALFSKLIPQLAPITNMVCLHVMGEPMLHPDLEEFLDISSKYKINISIVTNGTLLSQKHQLLLMHPAVKQINFSLQSFEANFKEKNNSTYLSNIFKFIDKTFEVRPDLHINLRLWNFETFDESLRKNSKTIKRIQDHFQIPMNIIEKLSPRGNHLKDYLYLNFSTRFDWPGSDLPFQSERGRCVALKNQLAILADGRVVPCCLDRDGEVELGNCNKSSILEILNSNRTVKMLNGFKQGYFTEKLCQHCTFNQRF